MLALYAGMCLLLALGLGPALLALGRRARFQDVPSARSTHLAPVPRVGGLLVAAALSVGWGVALWSHSSAEVGWAYVLPAGFYLLVGLVDDLRRLAPWHKFLGQASGAALAVALGLRWEGGALGAFPAVEFGALTPFMTWLWLIATVILVNFLDGIDLITVATATVLLAVGAGAGAGPQEGLFYACALGAVLGMGAFNRRPARLFAGDAGTHLLGFLVGSLALSVPGQTRAAPWALAAAPLLPGVVDVFLGLQLKARRGVSLAAAHSEHIYQRLTKAGATHAQVALRYGVLACAAVVAVHPIGTRMGAWGTLAFSLVVLSLHFVQAWRRTHHLPIALRRR